MKRRVRFSSENPVLNLKLPAWRSRFVLFMLFAGFTALAVRALYLQGLSNEFLQKQGESRYARTLVLPASRGKITDRNGVVVASSVPARAVWAIPEDVKAPPGALAELAKLLEIPLRDLQRKLANEDKTFVYLKRQVPVDVAEKVAALGLDGIHQQRETLRYYPEGEVLGHVLGFTNVEDRGQEGIELAYNSQLAGRAGSRRVIKDRLGRVVEDVQAVRAPANGHDLTLSIDTRVQYLVFSQLQEAVERHKAKGGAAIVVDTRTGEILALANMPTYNPNHRETLTGARLRNRALTDTFEPGSTIKPFSIALALDLGRVQPSTVVDTGGGRMNFYGRTISDTHGYGKLDVAGVVQKSSNIGTTLISQRIENKEMWEKYTELGLGQAPKLDFPGAVAGRLRPYDKWKPIEKATMSYGYGLSVSLVQMAHAYTAFARDGDTVPLTFLKTERPPAGTRIYSSKTARTMRQMLEAVVGPGGTASQAQVMGYRVAGKTGTARKIINGAYATKYVASFSGFAPVSNPRIVVAVMIDEPTAGSIYGGAVAGPVFSKITGGTLRMLGVEPDAPFKSLVIPEHPLEDSL
ncbi:peptidoglycan D,D-transpeptidase FtsI family protein [Pigmentiphaga kullae]|uniref:Peptidoglycan D,D-transpeptidase FtsI n=1 Tax=Pigmentiphaga kullae TaxID=151784 RepID=A0A4Q7N6F0_9BURK|nr:penicillin-binding protein 2 [Pigmentiphaga kullae]RZS76930.1 peptidoglycan synthetase FtsI [Pigmentiphaga kullae]